MIDSTSFVADNIDEKDDTLACETDDTGDIEDTTSLELQKEQFNSETKITKQSDDEQNTGQGRKLLLRRISPSLCVISYVSTETAVKKPSDVFKEKKSTRIMTPQERLEMRAARFHLKDDSAKTSEASKMQNRTGVKRTRIEDDSSPPDVDVLKKRGTRFGENVSSVIKKIEQKEKIMKRKIRFGSSTATPITGLTVKDEEDSPCAADKKYSM